MAFVAGVSGNPKGKPVGASDKRTQYRKLLEPHAPEIISKLIQMAKDGEPITMRLVVERLIPKIKDRPITFDLPDVDFTNADAVFTIGLGVMKGLASGDVTPDEAHKIATFLAVYSKSIHEVENARRISELEAKVNKSNHEV